MAVIIGTPGTGQPESVRLRFHCVQATPDTLRPGGSLRGCATRSPPERSVVGATGIEPVTPSMSTRCSPAELRAPQGVVVTGLVRISAPKRAGKDAWPGRCGGFGSANQAASILFTSLT